MEERLIAEVSRQPILYNTSLEEYKQVELKNAAWADIARRVVLNDNPIVVERIKNKWKNLRDTFVKSQRKKDRPNAKPWKLESEMKFLLPFLNPKLTHLSRIEKKVSADNEKPITSPESSNGEKLMLTHLSSIEKNVSADNEKPLTSPESSSGEKLLVSSFKKEDENESYNRSMDDSLLMQHVEAVIEDTPKVQQRKRKRESFKTENLRHFLDISDNQLPGPHESHLRFEQQPLQYDPVDSYFLGLAQTVKRLKPVNQVHLKKAISILVFDAELKETEAACEASSSSGNY